MKVWIRQELCTGDAQCVEICPDVFFMHDDGHEFRSYVRNAGESGCGTDGEETSKMAEGVADVPRSLEDAVVEAALLCPGECIFIQRG
jgi:ferredoxin